MLVKYDGNIHVFIYIYIYIDRVVFLTRGVDDQMWCRLGSFNRLELFILMKRPGCWVSRPSSWRLQQHGYLAWVSNALNEMNHSIDSNGDSSGVPVGSYLEFLSMMLSNSFMSMVFFQQKTMVGRCIPEIPTPIWGNDPI